MEIPAKPAQLTALVLLPIPVMDANFPLTSMIKFPQPNLAKLAELLTALIAVPMLPNAPPAKLVSSRNQILNVLHALPIALHAPRLILVMLVLPNTSPSLCHPPPMELLPLKPKLLSALLVLLTAKLAPLKLTELRLVLNAIPITI